MALVLFYLTYTFALGRPSVDLIINEANNAFPNLIIIPNLRQLKGPAINPSWVTMAHFAGSHHMFQNDEASK